MIKNKTILDKLESKTSTDKVMYTFLLDLLNHENENSQYKKQYEKLIDKAVKERGKNEI